jgi:hypothetical protein
MAGVGPFRRGTQFGQSWHVPEPARRDRLPQTWTMVLNAVTSLQRGQLIISNAPHRGRQKNQGKTKSPAQPIGYPGLITFFGAEGGTRTPTPLRVHGPEPCASANSATSAFQEPRQRPIRFRWGIALGAVLSGPAKHSGVQQDCNGIGA